MKIVENKINNLIIIIFIALTPFLSIGCNEDRLIYKDDSAPAPAQVTNVEVRDTHGGAVLTYTLPADRNLLYVRAEYEIQPGVVREAKSSFYSDTLVLEGFGDTRTYDVKLYSVGRNGKSSEPVPVQVNPNTPPVKLASVALSETFGGVRISFENPMKINLAIVFRGDTANTGYQSVMQTFYTSNERGSFSFKGLDSIPGTFSAYMRDRWDNVSEMVTEENMKPWFEMEIPYTGWNEHHLPGDVEEFYLNLSARRMWNDIWTVINEACCSEDLPLPQMLTVSLGRTLIMSTFQYWPRYTTFDFFTRGHAKEFELWGSMAPNPNGELDETWTPLGRFETIDDGRDIYQVSYPGSGYVFDIEESEFAPDPYVPIRYLRIKTISTFGSSVRSYVMYQGIKIYGAFAD